MGCPQCDGDGDDRPRPGAPADRRLLRGGQGYDQILTALVQNGQMRATDAGLARIALTLLAKAGPDGRPEIKTAFTIQNGQMFLGPAKLRKAPRLAWERPALSRLGHPGHLLRRLRPFVHAVIAHHRGYTDSVIAKDLVASRALRRVMLL